jgi:hypothetical protein
VTWVVSFKDSRTIRVSDVAGPIIAEKIANPLEQTKSINITDVEGNKGTTRVSALNGSYPETMWEGMMHEKNGEWICNPAGRWHKRGERCECSRPEGGHVQDQPGLRGSIPQEKWDQARRNIETLKRTGKMGSEGIGAEAAAKIDAELAERRARRDARAEDYRPRQRRLTDEQQQRIDEYNAERIES